MSFSRGASLTIPAVAEEAALRWPDAPALIEGGATWTFSMLFDQARAAASAFLARGIKKDDVIALWAPNRREWIVVALGAQMAGAIVTPLNTRLKGKEAADILRRSHSRLLFTVRSFLGVNYPALIAQEDLPDLKAIIAVDSDGADGLGAFLSGGFGASDPYVDVALAAVGADDISDILFTSGTTGLPKGVVSSHEQTVRLFREWSEIVDLRDGDRMLIINPFFHTFGYKAGWLSCLIAGATIVPMVSFEPSVAIQTIREIGVSFLPGPPTIFQTLLAERMGPSSLRVAVTGAATVPPVLIERMQNELGFETVITGYGMTECGVITMCRSGDDVERIATTCGKALPGLELKCVAGSGDAVAMGETGEILVRGFGVMRGYLDDPAATAETVDGDGWLHTGDLGVLDHDGYLRITDRKKDMYITGGFNCYPAEIEKLLCFNPKIEIAAVIGVPDERLGEVGKAFIVLRPGESATPEEIIAWSRENMANYKAPRTVEFRAVLPKNAAGKVMRVELKNEAAPSQGLQQSK